MENKSHLKRKVEADSDSDVSDEEVGDSDSAPENDDSSTLPANRSKDHKLSGDYETGSQEEEAEEEEQYDPEEEEVADDDDADSQVEDTELSEEREKELLERASSMRKAFGTSKTLNTIKALFDVNFGGSSSSRGRHYLLSGGSLDEIISLLQYIDIKRKSNTILVFQAIQITLLRTMQEKLIDSDTLLEMCKNFVTDHIVNVIGHLGGSTPIHFKKIAIKLLSALATVHDVVALQLLSSIDFTRDQLKLLTLHEDPTNPTSLRVQFIHFLLSLIVGHSPAVIRKLCSKKYWLSSIFMGLKFDLLSTVGLVLKTLDDYVIMNVAVPKTAKLFVFNSQTLCNLSDLYGWNPTNYSDLARNKHKKLKIRQPEPFESESVRELVHTVLIHLVTSTKYGVIFHDPTYGTTQFDANATVCQFMKECGQPWEDPLKTEMMSKMLSTCPDLLKAFYTLLSQQFQIQNFSLKWVQIAQFLIEAVSHIKVDIESLATAGRSFAVSRDLILPRFVLDSIASSLLGKKMEVLGHGLSLFIAGLSKCAEIAGVLGHRRNWYLSKISDYLISSAVTADKLLDALVSLHSQKSLRGIELACDAIFTLFDLAPRTLDPVKFNSAHMRHLGQIVDETQKEADDVLKIKLVKLQLLLDPQMLKNEGSVDLPKICGLITSTDSPDVKELGLSVIKSILFNTGFFLENDWELELWMSCTVNHIYGDFGKRLSTAVRYAEEHKFELSNTILRSHHQQFSSPTDTADLNLDDFLAMEDDENDHVDAVSRNLRLSPLLLGFLRANEKMGNVTKAFIVHYAHMVPTEGFVSLVAESLGKDHAIVDYLNALCRGEVTPFTFSPFKGSQFENISLFVLNNEPEDCLSELESSSVELVTSQVIRLAVLSQKRPKRLSRCVHLLENLVKFEVDGKRVLNGENVLRFSGLLDGFHPILLGTGNLNSLVQSLGQAATNRDHSNLKPFAHRIYFELECAAKKKSYLHDVNSEILSSFLKLFPMKENVKGKLIKITFTLKPKYFITKGSVTPWVSVVEHFLAEAISTKHILTDDELTGLINTLTNLIQHNVSTNLPKHLHNYLSGTTVDMSGHLLDAAVELLRALCTSDLWYEDLACSLMELVDDQLGQLPPGMEFRREVTLLAHAQRPLTRNLDHSYKSAAKAISSEQPYLVDLAQISSEAFSEGICSKLASKIEKNAADVYPSTNALLFLETIFSKSNKLEVLLPLVHTWLETCSSNNPDLCPGICAAFESVAQRVDVDLRPKLSLEIVDFLVSRGLSLLSKSMIEVIRLCLTSERFPLDPAALFKKLTAHEQFDTALMGQDETFKFTFVSLLSSLIEKDGSLISGDRLPGFLSAYQATLSQSDQLILKILQLYEKSGVILAGVQPFLWGTAALSYYSVNKKPSLSRSHPHQTLSSLSLPRIHNTITNFPIHRDVQGIVEGDVRVYDPAFVLPLLCQVALPGNKINSRAFFQSGAVGLALVSLSAASAQIRAVATLFLHRLHENHLGLDKVVWSNFIDVFRCGVAELGQSDKGGKKRKKGKAAPAADEDSLPRLSSLTATFLARASLALGDPADALYRPLHSFTLARPALKLYGVPAFLELLHSTDVRNHARHSEWILEVIRDGLREPRDLQLVLNSFAMKTILVYHSSSLASPRSKLLIEQIIGKCLTEADKENSLLLNKYSLLAWIAALPKKSAPLLSALPKPSPSSQHALLLSFATNQQAMRV